MERYIVMLVNVPTSHPHLITYKNMIFMWDLDKVHVRWYRYAVMDDTNQGTNLESLREILHFIYSEAEKADAEGRNVLVDLQREYVPVALSVHETIERYEPTGRITCQIDISGHRVS